MSHPNLAPVRLNCSRTISSKVVRGSTSPCRSAPLTFSEMDFFMLIDLSGCRPLVSLHRRALHQGAHNCSLVLLRTAQVTGRTAFLRSGSASFFHQLGCEFLLRQRGFCSSRPHWCRTDATEHNARSLNSITAAV